jgi:hypothetical protein
MAPAPTLPAAINGLMTNSRAVAAQMDANGLGRRTRRTIRVTTPVTISSTRYM